MSCFYINPVLTNNITVRTHIVHTVKFSQLCCEFTAACVDVQTAQWLIDMMKTVATGAQILIITDIVVLRLVDISFECRVVSFVNSHPQPHFWINVNYLFFKINRSLNP